MGGGETGVFFYIDPGTGSMLFTILIGVLSAAIYALRNAVVKVRFLKSGGRRKGEEEKRTPFVFFTDSKRYWSIFKPLCDEMEKREQEVLYLTAEEDDPMLKEQWRHVHAEFSGEGNKTYARMNMIKADVVLSSTPGLDVYQWKRSRDAKWYAHVLHAADDITKYRMFGVDYYDALLLCGERQAEDIRKLEKLRNLPAKETVLVGSLPLDALREKMLAAGPVPEHPTTVLLAPSWGPSSIFNRFGSKIIDGLLKTAYHIIIRPHPQSFVSEAEMINQLMEQYPESDRLEWNRDNDNFEVLRRSDVMISDFSGVMFDFALVFEKPVIYADVSFDKGPYDAWWLDDELWSSTTAARMGTQLTEDNIEHIDDVIENSLNTPVFREKINEIREEIWVNTGRSVESVTDYLIRTRERLLAEEQAAEEQKNQYVRETA